MDRKKIVHRLDTPYSAVEWPQISQEDQDTILELLCRLLAPLGEHRKSYVTPSKGQRKRLRKPEAQGVAAAAAAPSAPPVPGLSAYVDVGLSAISRNLQAVTDRAGDAELAPDETATSKKIPAPYSLVFVARSGQSSAFHCHFPQMAALASKSRPAGKAIRLVGFSKSCEERLSAALGIPRVSSIALREDAPQAKGLVDFVREHVSPVEIAWLEESHSGHFLETKIDAVQTAVGSKKPRYS
ncbi:hypothetical protein B0T26DRAFT_739661 [Lasiosphaeria miniovina]|uniref:Uncharacterized protein n=1 Tax=Lasiosphaeria miniovina TaxID=1954250 RepID=A0AA40E4P6_9PEZI|nr:uncharacterized protein B0T26DRAFT_739661 [Lasiosphaeria miniovina]KAK0722418.1 hypothetical protein B0T26DRAFT_739661 [Lasiosphaeria miniovina]